MRFEVRVLECEPVSGQPGCQVVLEFSEFVLRRYASPQDLGFLRGTEAAQPLNVEFEGRLGNSPGQVTGQGHLLLFYLAEESQGQVQLSTVLPASPCNLCFYLQ